MRFSSTRRRRRSWSVSLALSQKTDRWSTLLFRYLCRFACVGAPSLANCMINRCRIRYNTLKRARGETVYHTQGVANVANEREKGTPSTMCQLRPTSLNSACFDTFSRRWRHDDRTGRATGDWFCSLEAQALSSNERAVGLKSVSSAW